MYGTDFLLLESTGTWYLFWHSSTDIENKLDCGVTNFGPPQGNVSVITLQVYNTCCVHIFHCFFIEICTGKSKKPLRRDMCSQNCVGEDKVVLFNLIKFVSNFLPFIFRTLYSSQAKNFRAPIYRMYHRLVQKMKILRQNIIINEIRFLQTPPNPQLNSLIISQMALIVLQRRHQYGDRRRDTQQKTLNQIQKNIFSKCFCRIFSPYGVEKHSIQIQRT